MPVINEEHTKFIQRYVQWFKDRNVQGLRGVISAEVGDSMPPEVIEFEMQVQKLLAAFKHNNPLTVDLPNSLIPIFKRMMIEVRRVDVAEIEAKREKTHHPDLLQTLDERLSPINELMEQEWLRDIKPTRTPLLTEYIPLKRVEQLKAQSTKLQERDFDQKFQILQAPGLIIDDLAYFRATCDLRGTAVVLAFIDVDNFKKNFNEEYGEIVVDRRVLPLLMAKIEAHTFNHGFAYRHGGDEFVLILPNMKFDMATVSLDVLRRDIESLRYPGIKQTGTISIGFTYVDSDCFLTDREIVEKANKAKKFAKGKTDNPTEEKNRIATYRGTNFDEDDLYIVSPQYPRSSV